MSPENHDTQLSALLEFLKKLDWEWRPSSRIYAARCDAVMGELRDAKTEQPTLLFQEWMKQGEQRDFALTPVGSWIHMGANGKSLLDEANIKTTRDSGVSFRG